MTMPYEPHDRNHNTPDTSRPYRDGTLLDAANTYLERIQQDPGLPEDAELATVDTRYQNSLAQYHVATDLLDGTDLAEDPDLSALVAAFDGEDVMDDLSRFVSAVYNTCSTDTFVMDYDVAEALDGFGFYLSEDTTLRLETDVDDTVATLNYGTVVNDATVLECGVHNQGLAVNEDTVTYQFAPYNTGGAVNTGSAEKMGYRNTGVTVNYGTVEQLAHENMGLAVNFGEVTSLGQHNNGMIIDLGKTGTYETPASGFIIGPDDTDTVDSAVETVPMDDDGVDTDAFTAYTETVANAFHPDRPFTDILNTLRHMDVDRDTDGTITVTIPQDTP